MIHHCTLDIYPKQTFETSDVILRINNSKNIHLVNDLYYVFLIKSKSVFFELSLPAPTLITARSPSESQHVPTLLSFEKETEEVLEELGYPDNFHQVCITIGNDYLPKQWFMKLQEVADISEEHTEAIANAMLTYSQVSLS